MPRRREQFDDFNAYMAQNIEQHIRKPLGGEDDDFENMDEVRGPTWGAGALATLALALALGLGCGIGLVGAAAGSRWGPPPVVPQPADAAHVVLPLLRR